jgi:hypothetical protein
LFVDASGNVGLGITPVANTLIGGARGSSLPGLIELAGNGNGVGSSGFAIGQDSSGVGVLFQRANAAMYFATNGTERMRLTAGGLLGLGTSGPAAKLDVWPASSSDAAFRGNAGVSTQVPAFEFRGYNTNSTNGGLDIRTNLNGTFGDRLRITNDGLVGIGTSSPQVRLHTLGNTGSPSISADNSIALLAGTGGSQLAIGASGTGSFPLWLQTKDANNSSGPYPLVLNPVGGNVGIGTTSPGTKLDVYGSTARFYSDVDNTDVQIGRQGNGIYNPSLTMWTAYSSTNRSFLFTIDSNGAQIGYLSTLRFTDSNASYAERARIDSSGRLLVGTSSSYIVATGNPGKVQSIGETPFSGSLYSNDIFGPVFAFGKSRGTSPGSFTIVNNGDGLGEIRFSGADGVGLATTVSASITAFVDGTPGANDMPGRLVFSTTADGASSPTERMRINAAGALKASTNGTYLSSSDAANEIVQSNGSAPGLSVYTSSTSYIGSVLGISCNRNTTNNTYYFIDASVYGVAYRFRVADSGNVTNANNSYGAISDRKLKENIVDAASQWNDIKALQVRKYNFKEETGQPTHAQIGLIAQEVELISPGLVSESPDRDEEGNDLGTVTKSVNYSVLYMKAVKALQEAMERIEALEADVAALKGA